ncbi:hypothetical protein [Bradyrhizobium zhanjiangense]|uniref:hypothetical protein n=1 Tax=Bradyrhizobium zhanjiangense TaxID=1325107 RepID=UPI0013E8CAD1|nr:hypothetical protein [Bradyrhizobium zhanjiangense]
MPQDFTKRDAIKPNQPHCVDTGDECRLLVGPKRRLSVEKPHNRVHELAATASNRLRLWHRLKITKKEERFETGSLPGSPGWAAPPGPALQLKALHTGLKRARRDA